MIENIRDRIAHVQHDALNRAGVVAFLVGVWAVAALLIGGFTDACDRCKRSIQNTDHLSQGNVVRRFEKTIPTAHTAPAREQTGIFQRQQDLLKKLDGNLLLFGNFMTLDEMLAVVFSQCDERSKGILAFF